jgi:hypothetical protein
MSITDTADPAIIAAFEELRREVSLTRAALEGLTAARERIPDYTPTLGQIAERLKLTAAAAERIERAPAVSLSPEAMTTELVKAGVAARAADAKLVAEARDALSRTIGQVDGIVKRAQAADRQREKQLWTGASGILVGVLLWSALPGAVARNLPASWQVPGWMAARTLGMDRQAAGSELLREVQAQGNGAAG